MFDSASRSSLPGVRSLGLMTLAAVLIGVGALLAVPDSARAQDDTYTFVSIPDFLNNDIRHPEPKWQSVLDFTLESIADENPAFVLVAGDMVQGRWWRSRNQIRRRAKVFYGDWVARMEEYDLDFYTAVGDHELGDNPWREGGTREDGSMVAATEHIELYEDMYRKYLPMPENGPEGYEGLAYSFTHGGTLFLVVDTFERGKMEEGAGTATVSGRQLEWVEETLEARAGEVNHVVVMGHPPIVETVRAQSSSRLMLEGGRESPLWQLMSEYDVDLYLCGEVHAVTANERDGVQQLVHGSIFGYNEIINYVVGTVTPETIALEVKAARVELGGEKLYQTYLNHPREYLSLTESAREHGFQTVGKMVIDKSSGEKRFTGRTGILIEEDDPNTLVVEGNPETVEEGWEQGSRILGRYLK
mgnify:CR=1 FL=1